MTESFVTAIAAVVAPLAALLFAARLWYALRLSTFEIELYGAQIVSRLAWPLGTCLVASLWLAVWVLL